MKEVTTDHLSRTTGWQCHFSVVCFLIVLVLNYQRADAQETLWASKLLGYSSEYRPVNYGFEYRAIQILGAPNKLPDVGDSPCAWSPSLPNGSAEEWIKVGFSKAVPLRQVAIAENFNQGAIVRVYAYDVAGKELLIFENKQNPTKELGKMLRIFLPEGSNIMANAIKVVIDPSRVPGYNQLDAVGISKDRIPIEARINVTSDYPKNSVKENLGKNINTKAQEVAPVVSPDGKTLYFTRSKYSGNTGYPNKQDIWVANLDHSNRWSVATNLGGPINNAGDNAMTGISPDGKTIYLINVYQPDGRMTNGLSKSVKTKDGWSFPKECKIQNHYNKHKQNYTEFAISPKGNTLILSVERDDTQGNKDLYVSFLQPGSEIWSEPVNMGKTINTADYEGAPFIASDNKSVYFTSMGFSGYGSGDIFVSRRLDDSWLKWSEPENLGPVINTAQWDGYFNIPASGEFAYMSSRESAVGEEDIFQIRLFPSIKPEPVAIVSGFVFDGQSNSMVGADIVADIKKSNEEFAKASFDPATGEYKLILPLKEIYRITASREGFFPATEEIDLLKETSFRTIRKNIILSPIRSGQKILLNQLVFSQSKSTLDTTSFPELDHVARMMKQYPSLEILLEGHTDNQGDITKNVQLSEDRVQEVKRYLIAKGIAEVRIQTKAWGPARPIASNLTEQTRQKNRRVEFTILKI